ncbi:MAG: hypothetical protein IPK26_02805 [Planctomycetes bacterium]|nr:hypothetical protein [Planctomycetota bacterium]
MNLLALLLVGTALTVLPAQSLTTTFANNTSVAPGGCVYFDLSPTAPITITSWSLNLASPVGTPGTIDVLLAPVSRSTLLLAPGAWTLFAAVPVLAAGPGLPTTVALPPLALPPGTRGVALRTTGVAHAVTVGNGSGTFTGPSLTLTAGEATNIPFTAPVLAPRFVNCRIGYTIVGGGTTATANNYGTSCVPPLPASFYEQFAAGQMDLAGLQVTLVFTGNGYVAVPGLSPFQTPVSPTPLSLTDDSETSVSLTGTFGFPGGSTNTLTICSNGFVSAAVGNGISFAPSATAFLAMPRSVWGTWHDFNPSAGGQVLFHMVGSLACVTWDQVPDFGGASTSTFQMQFDLGTGFVHFVWVSMSLAGNNYLAGYSPGGPNVDPGSRDLTATIAATFRLPTVDSQGLLVQTAARPLLGATLTVTTAEIPVGALAAGLLFGLTQRLPGIDLTPLGLNGCSRYLDPVDQLLLVGPSLSWPTSLPIPNNNVLLGTDVYLQSIVLLAPPPTSGFGVTSDALALRLGNL